MFVRSALIAASVATGATGGAVATYAAMPANQPLEYFVACPLGDAWDTDGVRAPIFGGRVLMTFHDQVVELVGPVAGTDAGAEAAAVDYGRAYSGGACLPVPMWDVWKLTTPLIGEVGRYEPLSVRYSGEVIDCTSAEASDPGHPSWDPCHVRGFDG